MVQSGWAEAGGMVLMKKEAAWALALWMTDDEQPHQGSNYGSRGDGPDETAGRLTVFTWWHFGGAGRKEPAYFSQDQLFYLGYSVNFETVS